MRKVLMIFHSLEEALAYKESGGEYFAPHHFWCYDYLRDEGFQIDVLEFRKDTLLNKVGEMLQIKNLQQQVDCWTGSKNYDVIFTPYMSLVFFLAILKLLHLYRKPIVAVSHTGHIVTARSRLKRLKQLIVRYIYLNGIDSVLYINKVLYDESRKYSLWGNSDYVDSWGGDFEFFQSFVKAQPAPPRADYIYSTGGTLRDFDTLVKAFHEIDFKLKITTTGRFPADLSKHLRPNIEVNNSIKPGLTSTAQLREEYYNALAVAIPLKQVEMYEPFGYAVFVEALAIGKPIIISANRAMPFNVEKEQVGFVVEYGDVEGWRKAVQYLIDHPDEVQRMGQRAAWLAENKYNYQKFSVDVIQKIREVEASSKAGVLRNKHQRI